MHLLEAKKINLQAPLCKHGKGRYSEMDKLALILRLPVFLGRFTYSWLTNIDTLCEDVSTESHNLSCSLGIN